MSHQWTHRKRPFVLGLVALFALGSGIYLFTRSASRPIHDGSQGRVQHQATAVNLQPKGRDPRTPVANRPKLSEDESEFLKAIKTEWYKLTDIVDRLKLLKRNAGRATPAVLVEMMTWALSKEVGLSPSERKDLFSGIIIFLEVDGMIQALELAEHPEVIKFLINESVSLESKVDATSAAFLAKTLASKPGGMGAATDFARKAMTFSPADGMQLARELREGRDMKGQADPFTSNLAWWISKDEGAAMSWLSTEAKPSELEGAMFAVVSAWMRKDPLLGSSKIRALPAGLPRDWAVYNLVRNCLKNGELPEAQAWAAEVKDKEVKSLTSLLLTSSRR